MTPPADPDPATRLRAHRSVLEGLADLRVLPSGEGFGSSLGDIAAATATALGVEGVVLGVDQGDGTVIRRSGSPSSPRRVPVPVAGCLAWMDVPETLPPGVDELVDVVARHVGGAVETALLHEESVRRARIEQEYEIAARVQNTIIPRRPVPEIDGMQVAASARPARLVGGDFHEFLGGGERPHLLVVGDVSGKGLPAAMLTSLTVSTLSSKVEFLPDPVPSLVLARTNEDLYQNFTDVGMFVTVAACMIDAHGLRLSNAGHSPVVLRRVGRPAELIVAQAPPLGVLPVTGADDLLLSLDPDDQLVICTDGITDQRDPGGEPFGVERLLAAIDRAAGSPPTRLVSEIMAQVSIHAGHREQDDDQTVLVLTADPAPSLLAEFSLPSDLEALRGVPGILRGAVDPLGWDVEPAWVSRLELAVHELCLNAVTHGGGDEIQGRLWSAGDRFGVDLFDTGAGFDRALLEAPEPDEPTVHGYGLIVARKIADQLLTERRSDSNLVRLTIRRPDSPPTEADSSST